MKKTDEPFPLLAQFARHVGVEQHQLAMMIVLLALPLLSLIIAEAVAPFA